MTGEIARCNMMDKAVLMLGRPYLFGAKWDIKDPSPKGPIDCSGLVKYLYAQVGVILPDGSTNQHAVSVKLPEGSLPKWGDLGFLFVPADVNTEHHTGLIYDSRLVIEARGVIHNRIEIGTVCLHSRAEWEARPDFGGWYRPQAVLDIEGGF